MVKIAHKFSAPKRLRTRAERLLGMSRRSVAELPAENVQKLVHELQVHQIELEMQNDELRRTQLELQAARERLLLPYDAAPVGFLTLDAKGVILEANLAAARLLNIDRVKLAGQKLTHFIAPESQDIFYLLRRQLSGTGEKQAGELRLLRTGGPPFIARLEIVVEQAGPEPVARSLVMMSDITEQKQAEEALQKSRDELEERVRERTKELKLTNTVLRDTKAFSDSLVELAPAVIAVVDMRGNLIRTNAYTEQLAGVPFSETQGRDMVKQFVPDEEQPRVRNLLGEALQGRSVREVVVPFRTKDGGIRQIEWFTKPLANTGGETSALLAIGQDITERLNFQQALQSSEAKFRGFVESAPDGIVVVNEQGRIMLANVQVKRLFGYEPEELSGQPLETLLPERYRARHAGHFKDFFAAPRSRPMGTGLELSARRKDGSEFPVEITLSPVATAQGTVVFSAIRDISERKHAEIILQREKEFSESVIATAQTIILVLDTKGRIVRFNPYLEQLTGYRLAEVRGKDWFKLFLPEPDWKRIREIFLKAVGGDPIRNNVNPIRTKNGKLRLIEWNAVALKDAHGRATGVLSIGVDITERKLAEEALRRNEYHLSIFFSQAPIGLLWLSASGTILRANQAQLDLLGYPAEEYLGHDFLEFCADPAHDHSLLERLANKETLRNMPMTQRCKDGTVRHVLVDANSFWSENHLQYSSIFIRDVTDRVKLEREILEVTEREHRRVAQDLHDGLGQLLAGTAYLAGTLRKKLSAKSVPEARQLGRIEEVINESIELTRSLARGLHPVELEPNGLMVALQGLAARTKKLFHVRCHFHCPHPVQIHKNAVATHLFRIAQEAITNAIKHGQPKRVEISLTETPDRVNLAIRDNGAGMPAKLKKPGMGLRIMRYRAGMIGGSLAIQKERDGGTTVVCTVHLSGERKIESPPPIKKLKKD